MALTTPTGSKALSVEEKNRAEAEFQERERLSGLRPMQDKLYAQVLSELGIKHKAEEEFQQKRVYGLNTMRSITSEMDRRKFQWKSGQPEEFVKVDEDKQKVIALLRTGKPSSV